MQIVRLTPTSTHLDTVADRIWTAWWQGSGVEREGIRSELLTMAEAETFPFTLVATSDGRFAGTVSGIVSDLAERPQLTPWVAALWVEPRFRGKQLGTSLVDRALRQLALAGYERSYLPAKTHLREYYLEQGWRLIEMGVGPSALDVFERPTGGD